MRPRPLLLLLILAMGPVTAQPAATPQETEARQALERVRQQITQLGADRNRLDAERSQVNRTLREIDQDIDLQSRELRRIEAQIQDQESALAGLEREQAARGERLEEQRQALARLLRAAYAHGRHQKLKLLLAQDQLDSLARRLAYHDQLQHGYSARVAHLLNELQAIAQGLRELEAWHRMLDDSRQAQAGQLEALEARRGERRALLASLDQRFQDAGARLQALGRDEQALLELIEQLQDIFADIPEQLDAAKPLTARRGQLVAPLQGRTLVGWGQRLPDGRTSRGWLIEARAGLPVAAIAHGRVVFSDWLKGYGLLVIVDHGHGWMSLYAQNDSLHREVGDWVDAGTALASSGSSGGQAQSALYFELRRDGRPVDPAGWFARP